MKLTGGHETFLCWRKTVNRRAVTFYHSPPTFSTVCQACFCQYVFSKTEKFVWVWVEWSKKNLKSSSARVPLWRMEQRSITTTTNEAELSNTTRIGAVYKPVQKGAGMPFHKRFLQQQSLCKTYVALKCSCLLLCCTSCPAGTAVQAAVQCTCSETYCS